MYISACTYMYHIEPLEGRKCAYIPLYCDVRNMMLSDLFLPPWNHAHIETYILSITIWHLHHCTIVLLWGSVFLTGNSCMIGPREVNLLTWCITKAFTTLMQIITKDPLLKPSQLCNSALLGDSDVIISLWQDQALQCTFLSIVLETTLAKEIHRNTIGASTGHTTSSLTSKKILIITASQHWEKKLQSAPFYLPLCHINKSQSHGMHWLSVS